MHTVRRHTRSLLAVALALLTFAVLGHEVAAFESQESSASEPGVRFVFSTPAKEGKTAQAAELLTRRRLYLDANHRGVGEDLILRTWSPDVRRAAWILTFRDTASVERYFGRLSAEEGWQALESEMAQVFDMSRAEMWSMLPLVVPENRRRPADFWWRRTARATPDRLARAVRAARAEAEYINANYAQAQVEVYSGFAADLGMIFWFADFESSEAWRVVRTKLLADETYLDLLAGLEGLFVEQSWEERLDVRHQF